jgi:hypothetical protein
MVTTPALVTEQADPVAAYVGARPEVAVAARIGAVPPYVAVIGVPKFWIVCAWAFTVNVTVCGVAAAKLPAAGCVTLMVQVPPVSVVMTPVEETEQTAGVVEVYVGGRPEVVVAPIGVVEPTVAVVGTVGGIVITSAAGLTVSVSLIGVAAA